MCVLATCHASTATHKYSQPYTFTLCVASKQMSIQFIYNPEELVHMRGSGKSYTHNLAF